MIVVKEFSFKIQDTKIRIVNTWFSGIKLYVNGEYRDYNNQFFILSKQVLLSANLGDLGILEIEVKSGLSSMEFDAYLDQGHERLHIYSSHERISLKAQRLIRD